MADTATVTITLKEYDHLRQIEKDMNALIRGSISIKNNPAIDGNGYHVISTKELKTRLMEDLKNRNSELNRENADLEARNMELRKLEFLWLDRKADIHKKFDELRENSLVPINNLLKQLRTIANDAKKQKAKPKTRKARK